ncbi:hypothetical protein IQ270_08115 [Microcoleus sp. LEGE 07076]|uniref:hypothetical protein n=1 Tax=Microcoleus sp. LEGE 07076 TaxID=915322 RepID=UPI0019F1AF81|nr:hypothetical protein [Microcoleus sp. LEGE 07076]
MQIFRGDAPYGYLCGASLSKLCDFSCSFSGATHPTGICVVRRFQSFAILVADFPGRRTLRVFVWCVAFKALRF